jgi:hypothetical protein
VARYGLPRPYWAHFIWSTVAKSEYEVQVWSVRFCKFVPPFAMQIGCREARIFNLMEGKGVDGVFWIAASAIAAKVWEALPVEDGLSHDGASRISDAEE